MTIMEAAPIIKKQVTSRMVVEHYGFKPDRGGYICCPFHGEKTASLKVHKSGWYCYGCHEGGDAVEFIRLYERCRFNQAVAKADLYFGLNLIKAEKVTLSDIYAKRKTEQARRKEEQAVSATKTAFSAHLDKDWVECWGVYRDAWSTPADARSACQWWNMAEAEDMMEYIDYYQELTAAASKQEELTFLMTRYEKGVNRNANGTVTCHGAQNDVQAHDSDLPGPTGGHVRRERPAEQADQQAGEVRQ